MFLGIYIAVTSTVMVHELMGSKMGASNIFQQTGGRPKKSLNNAGFSIVFSHPAIGETRHECWSHIQEATQFCKDR